MKPSPSDVTRGTLDPMANDDHPPIPHLIAALGIRLVRVPDLPAPSILLPRHRIALVDTAMDAGEWEDLLDAVLALVSDAA